MPIAISDTHRELESVARSFLESAKARAEARALLDAPDEKLPAFWDDLVGLGWLGLHLPESVGGSGYGLPELVVVLQELGRAVAPGPFLPTVLASTVIATAGTEAQQAALLPTLADGTKTGALGFGDTVLGAGLADVFLLVDGDDVVVLDRDGAGVTVKVAGNLDPTRRSGVVHYDRAAVPEERVLRGAASTALDIARVLVSAEAAGGAQECVDRATEYAKQREQFGRVIAMFQAVKHHCANMLVASELATAAVWDAARSSKRRRPVLARGGGCRGASPSRVPPQRPDEHPGSRRHRLHVGARRAHVAPSRRDAGRALRQRRGRGRGHRVAAGGHHARARSRPPSGSREPAGVDPRRRGGNRRPRRGRAAYEADRDRLCATALAEAVGSRGQRRWSNSSSTRSSRAQVCNARSTASPGG